jgi:hypothetical protein
LIWIKFGDRWRPGYPLDLSAAVTIRIGGVDSVPIGAGFVASLSYLGMERVAPPRVGAIPLSS